MPEVLRILFLEDRAEDALLAIEELRAAGFQLEWVRVVSETEFRDRLKAEPDLILADYTLPQFDGLRALRIVRESGLDIPFIIVSGSIGEDLAVAAMQLGADDYLLKDRLARLAPAVTRALEQKRMRLEKRRAEQTIEESEKRFRALIEHSSDAVTLIDTTGRIVYSSPSVTRILGYPLDDYVGRGGLELAHPDDLELALQNLVQLRQLPQAATLDWAARIRHRDGSWRDLEGTATNLLGEVGVNALVLNFRDVTDRKVVEAALRESEQRFRRLFTTSPDAILLIDPHVTNVSWRIVDCNEAACQMNGYTRAELIGQSIDILNLTPGTAEERRGYLDRVRREGVSHVETFHRHKDGHIFPIETSTSLFIFEGRELVLGIDRDITERKRAEETLRDREARFRALIEHGSDLILVLDSEGILTYGSPSSARVLSYEPDEMIGRSVFDFVHPDDIDRIAETFRQLREDAGRPLLAQVRFHHKTGRWRYLEAISQNLLFDPAVKGIIINARDITERKQVEAQREIALEALRQAEASYRSLFESVPIGLYRATPQGQILDANEAMVRLLAYPDRETLLAANATTLYLTSGAHQQLQECLLQDGVIRNFELQLQRYDGVIIQVENNARLIRDATGQAMHTEGSMQDITTRKARERELEAIAAVSAALRTTTTHAQILPIVLDQISELLTVDGASIARRDLVTGESVFELGRGTGAGYIGLRTPVGAGVVGHVIQTGQIHLSNDVRHDPLFLWPEQLGELQAVACIPLVVQEQVMGALWVGRKTPILEPELRVLEAIADIAGNTIHRVTLFEAERQQRVLAESLREIAAALGSTLNVDEVLDLILVNIGRVVPHDAANIMLLEKEEQALHVARAHGYLERGLDEIVLALGLPVGNVVMLAQMTQSQGAVVVPDTAHHADWLSLPETAWVRSHVGAPIRIKGEIIGFLNLDSEQPGFFTTAHAERIQTFADQVAIAIENAQLYQEVRRYAEELETRVADRTRELTEANERLKELDRLKSKFVSDVSHELRTPLTSLTLHAELLEAAKPEKREKYIKVLQEQAYRLRQLVEDILNLSRLELGADRVQFEPVELNALVENIVEAHRPSAEASGLKLSFQPDPSLPPVYGESNQLAQVITNLVANAINYTPRGQVEIKTYRCDSADCLDVSDTGLGIDPLDVPHLFDRFYRGRQAVRSPIRGSGLGLAIVKEIVDLHQGTIEVESQVGKGSTFRIRLPVA